MKTFKVFITKYALTSGITRVEVESVGAGMVKTAEGIVGYYHKPDWHITWAAALTRAVTMRETRLASLQKQIEKLERLKWEEPK